MSLSASKCKCGFTLIELTIAIGIMGLAFLAIFSLVPVAVSGSNQAIEKSVETQIISDIQSKYRIKNASELPEKEDLFFDGQGFGVDSKKAIYRASVRRTLETQLPGDGKNTKLMSFNLIIYKNEQPSRNGRFAFFVVHNGR